MQNQVTKSPDQEEKIIGQTNASANQTSKPSNKTSSNYDQEDQTNTSQKYKASINVNQKQSQTQKPHPQTENTNKSINVSYLLTEKEEIQNSQTNQSQQKLQKTTSNFSQNTRTSNQTPQNFTPINSNKCENQYQTSSQNLSAKSQIPYEKSQKNQQKSQKTQETLEASKRLRDWQEKAEILTVPSKKRYEFCQGSIIFNIDPQYDLEKLIGSGIYGIVASGKSKVTNQPVAIKKISKLFNNFGDTRRVLRQIKVLCKKFFNTIEFLNHKNIIALQGIMSIENPQTFNEIYLIMEYMEFDLRRLIQSQMKITQQMIKFIMYQLLVSINFMHSADILHRDLKPENILMNKKCQLKLADMNLARKETYTGNITDYVASRPYRAPQILIGSTVYTKSVDIWSIGCIFAELLGKTIIFHGKDYIDQLKRFVAILGKPKIEYFPNIDRTSMESLTKLIAQIPDKEKVQWKYLMPNISDKAADLLDHMLTYDSRARFTAEECLNHPYLEEYKKAPRMKCKEVFDFSFDKIQLKQITLREAIYKAAEQFNAKKNNKSSQKIVVQPQEGTKKVKSE